LKTTISKLWKSIRRNPVINAFLIAVAAQIAHDFLAHEIDWTNILGYLSMVLIGVATREFTVPLSEHQDKIMEEMSRPRPTPGIPFPEKGE
jgi:hypothetical protein